MPKKAKKRVSWKEKYQETYNELMKLQGRTDKLLNLDFALIDFIEKIVDEKIGDAMEDLERKIDDLETVEDEEKIRDIAREEAEDAINNASISI